MNKLLQKIAFGKYLGTFISKGNGKMDTKVELFFNNIDPSLAERYLDYRYTFYKKNAPHRTGNAGWHLLSSQNDVYIVRIPVDEVDLFDAEIFNMYSSFIPTWSDEIFHQRKLEIILVDAKCNDKRRITWKE